MFKYAQGCLAGLCVGDALGSQLEFMHPLAIDLLDDKEIAMMVGSHIFHSKPGQITDDGEMAMCLVNSLLDNNAVYSISRTKKYYVEWAHSSPIDMGITTRNALFYNKLDIKSESNGALMRIAPLAIANYNKQYKHIINDAVADASITHNNMRVLECNAIFSLAIISALNNNSRTGEELVHRVKLMTEMSRFKSDWLEESVNKPEDYFTHMGHVKIAFQNAFYHLRNQTPFKKAIIDTIRCGGDTDTNASICGALMGAFWGIEEIPSNWLKTVIECKPDRPAKYHTNNILDQAKKLLTKS